MTATPRGTCMLCPGSGAPSGTALCEDEAHVSSDGLWYLPLNMLGTDRTETPRWQDCQKRCALTKGCVFFNNFPNGGCHITDGSGKIGNYPNNPTAMSGRATCPGKGTLQRARQ